MFRLRKENRALPDTALHPIAPERAVHTAEKFVRRAWALELARRHHREEFALQIERGNREAAIELLVAAQCDGDPERISAARTAVLQALEAIRAAAAARDQARRTLRKELRLLTRKPEKLAAAISAGQLRPHTSTATAPASAPPGPHHPQHPSESVDPLPRIRRPRPLLHLMRRWTGTVQQE
jgi:hypothetical protein